FPLLLLYLQFIYLPYRSLPSVPRQFQTLSNPPHIPYLPSPAYIPLSSPRSNNLSTGQKKKHTQRSKTTKHTHTHPRKEKKKRSKNVLRLVRQGRQREILLPRRNHTRPPRRRA
ncbi:hypothetical protein QBC47DRAFT_413768, partial [Echria macrotheca]